MTTDHTPELLERLSNSDVYKEYVRAFCEATGLPLRLTPVDDFQLAHHGRKHENPFCALMAKQTHFNRVFHNVVGESPTAYRSTSHLCLAA